MSENHNPPLIPPRLPLPRDDVEPPVLGAGEPFAFDPIQVWRDAYVARMVERGIDEADALACLNGAGSVYDYTDNPIDVADDEMACWDDDGGS